MSGGTRISPNRARLSSVIVCDSENDHFPKNIDELIPEYLDAVGDDPFSGFAYRYQQADNGYVIYSFGMDLEDNGGDEDKDIVIKCTPRDGDNRD